MNVETLLEVADVIEIKNRFDIEISVGRGDGRAADVGELYDSCDTVGCIAGWTCALFAREEHFLVPAYPSELSGVNWWRMNDVAQTYLGLTPVQARRLFHTTSGHGDPMSIWTEFFGIHPEPFTAKECAYLLREIADGRVIL